MNSDEKRRMGMNQGSLSEKMATHHLVVRKKLNVEQKQRELTTEETWELYKQNHGIIWCWVLAELGK
jgi:hypothetical protein